VNLLIVDDSLVVRNAVARGAVRLFGAPLLAADGQQAVELFRRHRPELVTMDLTMPHLDGLGAISAILELEPVTSILVISALNSQAIALEAIQRGACGFLTKPFTEPEVRHALEQLVTHAHEHRR
jgi:two-component system, chemotaxis family, chemotaxis protein CheY